MLELNLLIEAGELPAETLDELIEINDKSAYYNLVLSKEDILGLASERGAYLKGADRIEFGYETLYLIIDTFYKSPYINQFEYTAVLNELQYIFYALKNETGDAFTDEELIKLMEQLFNGQCCGSLELLKGKGAEIIIRLGAEILEKNKEETPKPEPFVNPKRGGNSLEALAGYTDDELKELEKGLFALLKELTYRYLKGRSASVRVETARGIASSAMFAVKLAEAGGMSIGGNVRNAYYKGVEIIDCIFEEAKSLYKKVRSTKTDTTLKSYNDTIESVGSFFTSYDKMFGADEIPANISYFPALCRNGGEGIIYVKGWLEDVLIENRVCAMLDSEELELVLSEYRRRAERNADWSFLSANIFELGVTNAIMAVMIGKEPSQIALTAVHGGIISAEYEESKFRGAVHRFMDYFDTQDTDLREYIEEFSAEVLEPRLKEAGNVLEAVILVEAEDI